MRSKAPLVLIELLVMFLVFSLAAGLCVKALVWSSSRSEVNYERDKAVVQAENVAQVIKSCSGDMDEAAAILDADAGDSGRSLILEIDTGKRILTLTAEKADGEGSANSYLGTAHITVTDPNGEEVFSLNTGWQEVSGLE